MAAAAAAAARQVIVRGHDAAAQRDATATERATEAPIHSGLHSAKFFSLQSILEHGFRDALQEQMSEFLAATSQRPAQRATAPVASPRSVRPHLSPRGWSARLTRSTTRSTRRFSLEWDFVHPAALKLEGDAILAGLATDPEDVEAMEEAARRRARLCACWPG